MPDIRETAALVMLLRAGERPWSWYAQAVEEAGSAIALLEQERERGGLTLQTSLLDDDSAPSPEAVAAEIEAWRADGIDLISVLDGRYPGNLAAVHDRPPFVFVAGSLSARDERSVAVVGARAASPIGVDDAGLIARCLANAGYVVVSGLAAGVDTAAHEATLAVGGRTIAVIGTGLRRAYPPENVALQRKLADEHAVISQFWPDAPPTKQSFPMRNGVMSGVTLATVIVEASHTSGSRIQARLALEQGRPVLLWHRLMSEDWARQFAGRPGAHVVRTPEGIVRVVERLTSPGTLVG